MTDTSDDKTNKQIEDSTKYYEIDSLANDYADYFHIDGCLQIQQFEDSIEELLTKLDEYHGLLDMIRSDTTLCLQKNLPLIQAKARDLERIFDKIDKLEVFVAVVKKNMLEVEEKVLKAETELATLHGIRKVLSSFPVPSFFSPKTSATKPPPKYEPPDIFRTKDFIVTSSSAKNASKLVTADYREPVNTCTPDGQVECHDSPSNQFDASERSVADKCQVNPSESIPAHDQSESECQTSDEVVDDNQSEKESVRS